VPCTSLAPSCSCCQLPLHQLAKLPGSLRLVSGGGCDLAPPHSRKPTTLHCPPQRCLLPATRRPTCCSTQRALQAHDSLLPPDQLGNYWGLGCHACADKTDAYTVDMCSSCVEVRVTGARRGCKPAERGQHQRPCLPSCLAI